MDDDHARRVTERAADQIASAIRRYRAGDLSFPEAVRDLEMWINSIAGSADPEWVDEWRSRWNPLEYVFASMIEDRRDGFVDDEERLVRDAMDALEAMSQR